MNRDKKQRNDSADGVCTPPLPPPHRGPVPGGRHCRSREPLPIPWKLVNHTSSPPLVPTIGARRRRSRRAICSCSHPQVPQPSHNTDRSGICASRAQRRADCRWLPPAACSLRRRVRSGSRSTARYWLLVDAAADVSMAFCTASWGVGLPCSGEGTYGFVREIRLKASTCRACTCLEVDADCSCVVRLRRDSSGNGCADRRGRRRS